MPALRHDNVSSMTEYLQSCCEAWLGTPGLFLEPGMYTPALPELAPEPPPELAPEPKPEPTAGPPICSKAFTMAEDPQHGECF